MSQKSEFNDVAFNISWDVSSSPKTFETGPDHGHPAYDHQVQRAYEQPGCDQHGQQEHVYGYDQNGDGLSESIQQMAIQPTPNATVCSSRPPDYMFPSILVCVFCFLPTGLLAIIFSLMASNAAADGDMERAKRMSSIALSLVYISVAACIICAIVIGLVVHYTNYAKYGYGY